MRCRCRFFLMCLLVLAGYPSPTPLLAQKLAFTHLTTDDGLPSNIIMAVLQDHRGYLWFGTWGVGLVRYDGYEMKVYRHVAGDSTSLSDNVVRALYETTDGTLWVGTWYGGLNRFDPVTETFKTYRHVEGDSTSLSDDNVEALHASSDGTLWVGTIGSLNRFDPVTETFKVYRHAPGDPTSLSDDRVRALHETSEGTLWVGTQVGLNRFDAATETFEVYRHVPGDLTSLSHDHVRALYETEDGTLWVGTWGGGLSRYNAVTETFEVYRHEADNPISLLENNVEGLLESADGTLWVGTGGGLNRFGSYDQLKAGTSVTETTKGYRHAPGDPASLAAGTVLALLESADGTLWIGTADGLNRFDVATETFKTYRHVDGDSTSLSDDNVEALLESTDGTLWIGTADGLNRLEQDPGDPTSVSFTRFLTDMESPIGSVIEDEEGQLWLGLENGRLIRFNPVTGQARSFGKRFGLPAGYFNTKVMRSRTGRLYWSNMAGLISLRLDRLPPPGAPPRVELSALWLFDESLTPGPDSPLKQTLWQTQSLRLSHDQNDLTFGFVAIHYADPAGNRYQYRLLGYDRDWRSETDQRRATYTNLPPGSYTFEVKAANSDGIWTPEPVRLGVEILPPWWRTGWAYMLYGLLLIGSIFTTGRIQRRRLIAKERQRAAIEQERLRAEAAERELAQAREIERAYHELRETKDRLVQQEKMASLGQLTAGIAHEIKNPLNFVNNFAEVNEELAQELREAIAAGEDLTHIVDDLEQNARVIAQHGKRADGIVHAMMQHASGGTGQRELTEINQLVSEHIDLAYHGKRAQMPDLTVAINRDLDEEVGTVEVVPQEIGRVLLNLLGNAFDAVRERADTETRRRRDAETSYVPTVTVSTRRNGEAVEIRIADNGPGIHKDFREKIFEPFFTTKPTGTGTGLGLSLSYDIITQGHSGTLTVESEEGAGATFIVTLPVSKTKPASST